MKKKFQKKNVKISGGYLNFAGGRLKGEINGLPKHSQIRIKTTLYLIDGWRKGEGISLKFGEKLTTSKTMEGENGCDVLHTIWNYNAEGKIIIQIINFF